MADQGMVNTMCKGAFKASAQCSCPYATGLAMTASACSPCAHEGSTAGQKTFSSQSTPCNAEKFPRMVK